MRQRSMMRCAANASRERPLGAYGVGLLLLDAWCPPPLAGDRYAEYPPALQASLSPRHRTRRPPTSVVRARADGWWTRARPAWKRRGEGERPRARGRGVSDVRVEIVVCDGLKFQLLGCPHCTKSIRPTPWPKRARRGKRGGGESEGEETRLL